MTLVPCGVSLARTSPLRHSGESSFGPSPIYAGHICLASTKFSPIQPMTYYQSMTDGLAPSQHLAVPFILDHINMGPGWGFCTSYPIHDHVVPCILPGSHSLLHRCSGDEQLSESTILLPMPPKG